MSTPEERRTWLEAIHSQNVQSERLFKVILELCQGLEQGSITSAFSSVFGANPTLIDECVAFSDIALRFDEQGKLLEICRVVDGKVVPFGKIEVAATIEPQ